MRSGVSSDALPIEEPRLRMYFSRAAFLRLSYLAATTLALRRYGLTPLSFGIPTGLFLLLLTDAIVRPGSSLFCPVVTHGKRAQRKVALSFDDGPDPAMTPAVLDVLARHQARATFFVIGRALDAHRALGQRIVREGHELGNHSWRHSRWHGLLSTRAHAMEIQWTADAISEVNGGHDALFRPPLGLKSPPLARAARNQGARLVTWSLHSRDTYYREPSRIARYVLDRVRPGDIILLHDGHDLPGHKRRACAAATDLILQGLSQAGLECVTVSELLAENVA
jgi:peptidoglycan/xylan/chitin deacetylase (PgdA/CDA1 family)